MKRIVFYTLVTLLAFIAPSAQAFAAGESTKQERNAITEGNKLYNRGRYRAAMQKYEEALRDNGNSAVARYNLGLSQIRIGSNPSDTTQAAKEMVQKGCQQLEQVAKMGSTKPALAAKANYNLGNVSFNSEDYQNALNYYKQALRLDPADESARRNLRITQLKIQNQNDNKDNNDDKKDQDQDKQDQNKDQQQNQQQNQDQNQQNQDQKDQQQQQQQPQDLNQQTADQILQAMENKENQTRARVTTGNPGEKSEARRKNPKNW